MNRHHKPVSPGGAVITLLVFLNAIILKSGYEYGPEWHKAAFITLPLLIGSIIIYRNELL